MKVEEIKFITSLLAKSVGLPATSACYNDKGESVTVSLISRAFLDTEDRYSPRVPQSVLQTWLRDTYGIQVDVHYSSTHKKYSRHIYITDEDTINIELEYLSMETDDYFTFDTYEEALEDCLVLGCTHVKSEGLLPII